LRETASIERSDISLPPALAKLKRHEPRAPDRDAREALSCVKYREIFHPFSRFLSLYQIEQGRNSAVLASQARH
jgi:hypothetical protein